MSQPIRPNNTAAAAAPTTISGATPALQVNRRAAARQHLPQVMRDVNTMGDLAAQSADNAIGAGGGMSSQKSSGNPSQRNNNRPQRVVQAPAILTLPGVRQLLLRATAGGREALDDLVVLDQFGNPTVANGSNSNNINEPQQQQNQQQRNSVLDNVQLGDKVIASLLEGCEPGLRHALEMLWLSVGRDTRKFVTAVQSCSEASILQNRQRIHFGFEVKMETLVCHLAPNLAARLEQLPTTVYGVSEDQHQLRRSSLMRGAGGGEQESSPASGGGAAAASSGGRALRSNGASPQAVDMMMSSSNPTDNAVSRSALRRQRAAQAPEQQQQNQQEQANQQQQQSGDNTAENSNNGHSNNSQNKLEKFVDSASGATLFSPLRSNTNLVGGGGAAAQHQDGLGAEAVTLPLNGEPQPIIAAGGVVGGLVGVSRTVEDKVWVDVADLFCDAVSMMGGQSRDKVMQLVFQSLPEALTEPWRVKMMNAMSSNSKMHNGGNNSDGVYDENGELMELIVATSAGASKANLQQARGQQQQQQQVGLDDDDSSSQNPQQQQQQGDQSKPPGERAEELTFRSSATTNSSSNGLDLHQHHQQQQQQDADFIPYYDPAVFTANRDLRALLHDALTTSNNGDAEAARQMLIDLLRAVSSKGRNNNNGVSQQQQQQQSSSFLPKWTDGIPHNDGSATFINEMLVAEYRTPHVNYLTGGLQPNLTQDMRVVLVDWLHAICTRLKMSDACFHLNVALLDRALVLERDVSTRQLQLLGIAGMLLASKYHEIAPPPVTSFVYMSANAYSTEDILTAERFLFNLLDAYVTFPSTLEAADLILAEQEPPATNEQRAFVHFLLHTHLHFHVYGGQGHVIEAARVAVFLSRVEFGMPLASEIMLQEQQQEQEQQQQSPTSTTNTSIDTSVTSAGSSASKPLRRRVSNVSRMSTDSGANRSCSHLPFFHVDACFLSESESRLASVLLDDVQTLRNPQKKAGDLVGRYSQPRYFGVTNRFGNAGAVDAMRAAAVAAAGRATAFLAMHLPRTPGSSTGSSPQSAKSLRGD